MKISNRTIASLGLVLAVSLALLCVLASMRKITPDLVLRSTLREIIFAADKNESPEKLRQLAVKGLDSAGVIERMNSNKDDWAGAFFVGAVGVGALSLLIIAVRKKEANQALLPTPTAVTPAASHPSRQP